MYTSNNLKNCPQPMTTIHTHSESKTIEKKVKQCFCKMFPNSAILEIQTTQTISIHFRHKWFTATGIERGLSNGWCVSGNSKMVK